MPQKLNNAGGSSWITRDINCNAANLVHLWGGVCYYYYAGQFLELLEIKPYGDRFVNIPTGISMAY